MKTKLLLVVIVLLTNFVVSAQVPDRKGLWKFDDPANLLKSEIGTDLVLTGTQTSVNGLADGNMATQIGLGSYLTMEHGMSANGGGAMVNEWTLQIDFSVANLDAWYAFFQTNIANSDDADMFVKKTTGVIGTSRSSYSVNAITANTWYRLMVTAKQSEFFRVYVDGVLWVDTPDLTHEYFNLDGRWALGPNLMLFGDDDGDDGLINCSEVAIWDVALTPEQVELTGDADTKFTTISQVPDRKGLWKFDDPANLSKSEIGTDLVLTGTQTSVNGPADGNMATQIGLGSYLTMEHGMSANGGGAMVNEWTLQIDFSVANLDAWYAFFQTNIANSDDADMFVKKTTGVIGTSRSSYSVNAITANTWYRLMITAKQGEFFRVYVDGVLWVDTPDLTHEYFNLDGRWALGPNLMLFGDDDGDDGLINCSEVAIWDVALTPEQVEKLGAVISIPTGIRNIQSDDIAQLGQNYPNPFSHSTTIPYQILNNGNVSFRVLDITGKAVKMINEGVKSPGKYTMKLSSENLGNGIYFLQMLVGNQIFTRKMTINQ
jgi:hypothetical protein